MLHSLLRPLCQIIPSCCPTQFDHWTIRTVSSTGHHCTSAGSILSLLRYRIALPWVYALWLAVAWWTAPAKKSHLRLFSLPQLSSFIISLMSASTLQLGSFVILKKKNAWLQETIIKPGHALGDFLEVWQRQTFVLICCHRWQQCPSAVSTGQSTGNASGLYTFSLSCQTGIQQDATLYWYLSVYGVLLRSHWSLKLCCRDEWVWLHLRM